MVDKTKKSDLFFRQYTGVQNRLYAYILMMVHNDSDAEELLQETAALLWEHFDDYQAGTNFGAWACCIARNKVIDFVRKNKKSRPLFAHDVYDRIAEIAMPVCEDITDRIRLLNQCMAKLKEADQSLVAMRFQEKMPIKQMSLITGRSADGLYKTMTRILGLLRQCIDRGQQQGEAV